MRQFLILLILTTCLSVNAQSKVFISGGDTIDEDRYDDVKGDPFLYDDLCPIVVLESNGKKIDGVKGRFNTHTGYVEVQQENGFIPLEERRVLTILFVKDQDSIQFVQGRAFGINQPMVIRSYTGNNFDFIELYNRSNAPVNLGGYKFIQGVDMVFPNMMIGAGEYLVITEDPSAFTASFGDLSNQLEKWKRTVTVDRLPKERRFSLKIQVL